MTESYLPKGASRRLSRYASQNQRHAQPSSKSCLGPAIYRPCAMHTRRRFRRVDDHGDPSASRTGPSQEQKRPHMGGPSNPDNLDRQAWDKELMTSFRHLVCKVLGIHVALEKRHPDLVAHERGGGYARISQRTLSLSSFDRLKRYTRHVPSQLP